MGGFSSKRLLAVLAAALLLLAVSVPQGCAQYTHIVISTQRIGDLHCSIYEDGTIEIVKYMGNDSVVAIPSGLGEYTVVGISTRAFYGCEEVEEVFLPSTITTLPAKLFDACPNLKAVYIPLTVKSIGKNLINDCPSFTTLRFAGTEAQWNSISKGSLLTENFALSTAEYEFEYKVGE